MITTIGDNLGILDGVGTMCFHILKKAENQERWRK